MFQFQIGKVFSLQAETDIFSETCSKRIAFSKNKVRDKILVALLSLIETFWNYLDINQIFAV